MTPAIKVWGTTEPLIRTPMFELHRLRIKPLHRCSLHVHQFKHNAFYVLDGHLFIDTCVGDFGPTFKTSLLYASDIFTIDPGVHHQFRTGPNHAKATLNGAPLGCLALEMYFTEPLSEDIIRRNIGAPVDG